MELFEDFRFTGFSYQERLGKPDEFHAALGQLVVNFTDLNHSVLNVIRMLMSANPKLSCVADAETPFSAKLDMLTTLVRDYLSHPSECPHPTDAWKEIHSTIELCRKAEGIHNSFLRITDAGAIPYRTTAKGENRPPVRSSEADAGMILDVADYISYAANFAELIPLILGLADLLCCQEESAVYTLLGETVATF